MNILIVPASMIAIAVLIMGCDLILYERSHPFPEQEYFTLDDFKENIGWIDICDTIDLYHYKKTELEIQAVVVGRKSGELFHEWRERKSA